MRGKGAGYEGEGAGYEGEGAGYLLPVNSSSQVSQPSTVSTVDITASPNATVT